MVFDLISCQLQDTATVISEDSLFSLGVFRLGRDLLCLPDAVDSFKSIQAMTQTHFKSIQAKGSKLDIKTTTTIKPTPIKKNQVI